MVCTVWVAWSNVSHTDFPWELANHFHLDKLPGQSPSNLSTGSRRKVDDCKRRELQTYWVPVGDHETVTNESTHERVNTRTNQRTNQPAKLQRIEADESTPSYQRTPVVGWSMLIIPELRDVSFPIFKCSINTVYVACGVLIPCPGYPRCIQCTVLAPCTPKLHCAIPGASGVCAVAVAILAFSVLKVSVPPTFFWSCYFNSNSVQ